MLLLHIIFAVAVTHCGGSRILFVNPIPSYSHQIIYQPIWKELALRGHDVVVITPDPIRESSIENLKEIDVSFVYDIWRGLLDELAATENPGVMDTMMKMMDYMYTVIEEEFRHPEVESMINNKSEYFDLVMIEYMIPTMFAFKQRFNCPFIGISSMEIGGFYHEFLGNPRHAVLYPEVMFGFTNELTFFERMSSVFAIHMFEMYWRMTVAPKNNEVVEKYFGPGYKDCFELAKSVDMVFINSNPAFYQTRPITPATVMISGGIHIKPLKPLPQELDEYLNNSEGVIYFSLGSNVKSKDIPPHMKDILIKVFSELPYDILWKYETEELPGKPENVKIIKWAPQQDILRHPKVKLFITQAGMQSLEEALFSHVPMVAIPFFADQHFNAKRVAGNGLGLIIENYATITAEDLEYKILEVINNPKYKNRVKELADRVKDEPMTALEKAVWWTEYVLRHGGAQHLKGKTLPLYQFYYVDVISFLLVVSSIIFYILQKIIRKCITCIFAKKSKVD